jgi:hypothetical protein
VAGRQGLGDRDSRVPARPPNETFHEFIVDVLRETLGEAWRAAEAALPEDQRHFVFKCFEQLSVFLKEHTDSEELAREGQMSAEPNGWVRYLISLAWDVATLSHPGEPPAELIDRLRDRDNSRAPATSSPSRRSSPGRTARFDGSTPTRHCAR